jgi:hypothetical protein
LGSTARQSGQGSQGKAPSVDSRIRGIQNKQARRVRALTLTPPADWPEAMVVVVGKPVSFAGDQLGSSQRVALFIVPKAGAS